MGKTEDAYNYIKNKIIYGEYPPLSDLSEEKIQKELEISRTPVREAILRLEKEGFVYIYPRKGTIVTDVTQDLLDDVYEVREMFEPRMAVQAMSLITDEWLQDIQNRFMNPPEGMSTTELQKYYSDVDTELHSHMMIGTSNRYIKRIMDNIYDQNLRLRLLGLDIDVNADFKSLDEHCAIIEALRERNADKVSKAVYNHLVNSRKRIAERVRLSRAKKSTNL